MKKILLLLPAVFLLVACAARADTTQQEVAVHQNGYVTFYTDKTLSPDCVPPGHNQKLGWGDKSFTYPAGERQWKGSTDPDADRAPYQVPTSDHQVVSVFATLKFYLATEDCKILNAFHTRIGSKLYNGHPAYVNDGYQGWDAMLATRVNDPVETVMNNLGPKYATLDLWGDTGKAEFQKAVLAALPAEMKAQNGGAFFNRFTLTVTKIVPPEGTLAALQREANAKTLNAAQLAENATSKTRYAQITACTDEIHNLDVCAFIYAVDSGKVAAVVPPGGAVVTR